MNIKKHGMVYLVRKLCRLAKLSNGQKTAYYLSKKQLEELVIFLEMLIDKAGGLNEEEG